MQKKNFLTVLLLTLLCLCAFGVSAQVVVPVEKGGSSWKLSLSENRDFIIEIDVPDGFTQKTELTLPSLRYNDAAGTEIQIAPVPPEQVYADPDFSGCRSWTFRLKDLKYPLRVVLALQECSNEGICFAPEQLEIGPFENEEGLLEFCELETVQTESDSEKDSENSDESASGRIDRNLMKTEENMVLLPDFEILCAGSGYRQPGEFLNFLKGDNDDTGIYYFLNEETGFFLKLILALLGGLALNLTPCTLPLFPVNLAVIGASYSESDPDSGKSGKKRVMRGVCYSLGILVAYTVLGILCSAAGASVGRWSAMPAFRLGASVIFLILGLSMFGIVHLDLSRFRNGIPFQPGKSGWGVFFLGCLTAVLAGACVSPVLAAVLVYTAQMCREGDFLKSILLPASMGLGFALPWPFLQAGLNFLPKPGKWMKYVNGVFGSLLLIAAVYYGWSGAKGMTYAPDPAVSDPEQMVYDLRNALDLSAQTGKPVFVKFTAPWCTDCRAMERTTYTDLEVSRELEKCVVLELNMEHPEHPVCGQLLELFDFQGFPSYALIKE